MMLIALYQSVAGFVYGLVNRYRLGHDHTEDVLQTVWLEVVRHRLKFEGEDAATRLCRWLPRVVRSKVADLLRRERRQPRQAPGERELDVAAPEEDDPPVRLVNDSERESVRAAVARLREDETGLNRRLLDGRYVEGRSVTELAAAEGLTPPVVSRRLYRLLMKLRARLLRGQEG